MYFKRKMPMPEKQVSPRSRTERMSGMPGPSAPSQRPVSEGLGFVRMMMVLSGATPLFIVWAIHGIGYGRDVYFVETCIAFIVVPNAVLIARLLIAKRRNDCRTID